jgi:hypothetical protein
VRHDEAGRKFLAGIPPQPLERPYSPLAQTASCRNRPGLGIRELEPRNGDSGNYTARTGIRANRRSVGGVAWLFGKYCDADPLTRCRLQDYSLPKRSSASSHLHHWLRPAAFAQTDSMRV